MSPKRNKDEVEGANPPDKVATEAADAAKALSQPDPGPKKPRRRRRKTAPSEEPVPAEAPGSATAEAEAAQDDADPAQGDAEAAQGDAEAAQGDAEAAQGDAQAAQGDAEAAPKPTRRRRRSAPAESSEPVDPEPAPRRRRADPGAVPAVVRARAKYVRTSARKARLVSTHIQGKTVEEARAILAFAPRAAARDWSKLLESAVANAEHNHELGGDELRGKDGYADEGPTVKRFRPRAMGRATRIRKRTSHLTITLTPNED